MKFLAPFALTWALFLIGIIQAQQLYPLEVRYRLTTEQLQAEVEGLFQRGYRLNYVSGYTIGKEARYTAIWELKPSSFWVARADLSSAEYQNAFNVYVSQGYRLVLVNGYTVEGQDRYVAIWDKSPSGPWIARHGLTSTAFQAEFNSTFQQGYRLRHVSGYTVSSNDDQVRYAAIWEKTKDNDSSAWSARIGLSFAEAQKEYNLRLRQGFRLTDISGYGVGGVDVGSANQTQDNYTGIWELKGGPAWVARIGLTVDEFQSEYDNHLAQRYVLKVLNGYTVAGSDRYAAIWEHVPDTATLCRKDLS